jgi:hypothetical protein
MIDLLGTASTSGTGFSGVVTRMFCTIVSTAKGHGKIFGKTDAASMSARVLIWKGPKPAWFGICAAAE